MTIQVYSFPLLIPLLTSAQVHALPTTKKDGSGTRHVHADAYCQIDYVDPESGVRYTGNANIQCMSREEQAAAKTMPKDPKTGKKQTFVARDFVASLAKAEAAE